MKIKTLRFAAAVCACAVLAPQAPAFTFIFGTQSNLPTKWTPATTTVTMKIMVDDITPLSDGTTRAAAIKGAMLTWNTELGDAQFDPQITAVGQGADGNGINEVFFSNKPYNQSWDSNTLAITTTWASDNQRVESDIIFNTAFTWDSYRGPLQSGAMDIRRVALHELGHALGLNHPDQATPAQTVTAVMNSHISNVDALEPDDIAGAQSLYGPAPLGTIPPNDNFANAIDIGNAAQVTGTNVNATRETGEPIPDTSAGGSTGGHSVWWKWTAPSSGNVTADTKGSLFDTTLGVFTGTAVSALTQIAYNDDVQSGVIRTSSLNFSATAGTTYYFCVDGFNDGKGADSAAITLNLSFASSSAPAITGQPASDSAVPGGSVTFSVTALGSGLSYQWMFNGTNIAGATSSSYTIGSVTTGNAGNYSVAVTNSNGTTTSNPAMLTVLSSALPSTAATTGHNVSFSAAGAVGAIQWQVSTNSGGTWINLTDGGIYGGTTSTTLTLTGVTALQNGYEYRYVASNLGSTATSNAATLSVAAAVLPFPASLTVNGAAVLVVGDASTDTVQDVAVTQVSSLNGTAVNGSVSLLAGTGGQAGSTDGKGATALFNQPSGVASAADGSIYVADTANSTIRRIAPDGTVSTLAGSAGQPGGADGTGTNAHFNQPAGLAVSGTVLYVADAMNNTIRAVMTSTGAVTTLAGSAGQTGSTDGTGTSARFNHPTGVAVDGSGTVYVSDSTNNTIRRISSGNVTTLAGLAGVSGSADGTSNIALFNNPTGLAVDSADNLYVTDTGNSCVRKITPQGVVVTIAGLPTIAGLEDGTGTGALFNQPRDLALDGSGNLFVADTGNAAIREIAPAGVVSTVALAAASTGSGGSSGGGSGGSGSGGSGTSGGGGSSPSSTSSGGGGGGGAMEAWLVSALGLILLARCSLKRT